MGKSPSVTFLCLPILHNLWSQNRDPLVNDEKVVLESIMNHICLCKIIIQEIHVLIFLRLG